MRDLAMILPKTEVQIDRGGRDEYCSQAMHGALIFAGMATGGAGIWLAARWLGVFVCIAFAARKRSLTIWILAGLVAGAAMGYDFPAAALKLQVLGLIFLRLIKV